MGCHAAKRSTKEGVQVTDKADRVYLQMQRINEKICTYQHIVSSFKATESLKYRHVYTLGIIINALRGTFTKVPAIQH